MPNPCQIRPYQATDWPVVWAMLEPVFRAGETYAFAPDKPSLGIPHDELRALPQAAF
jgi:hypothetical protein